MPQGTLLTLSIGGTYPAHGNVTGFEYEDLSGVTVTATNLATGDSSTTAADDTGAYSIDIGDATSFPHGYNVGDVIQLTVAKDSTTRVWKRRVAGTEIVQDLWFTHGTWKGALRRAKLLTTEIITKTTGQVITLRDGFTRDVLEVRVNSAPLAASAWTFSKPTTVTLTASILSSDVVEVDRTLYRSIDDAKTEVVAEGDGQVRNAMARYYPSPLPARVPELQDISEALAAARMRDLLFSGADKNDADASSLRKFARDRLKELYDGTRNLTDQDGAYLSPTAKSTTTPQAAPAPTRAFTTAFQDRYGARKQV